MCIYIDIYIYIERERERRESRAAHPFERFHVETLVIYKRGFN